MTATAPPRRGLGLTVPDAVARIRTREHIVHAFVTARLEEALAEGKAPRPGPLSGVPFGLKDVWDVAGWPTTRGSIRNRHYLPTVSGPIARTFLDAGAVLIGKTNVSDLALTPESASLVGGRTTNPHDPTRTSGGSSGGAAAAVADGMVGFDWGSDFGGSIRLPAAFCGIVGLRLSSEVWPPEGKPYNVTESHLNGQGPMTATLADCRRLLAIAAPRLRNGAPSTWRARGICLFGPDPAKTGAWPGFLAEATALAVAARVPIEPVAMPSHDVIDAAIVALVAAAAMAGKANAPISAVVRSLIAATGSVIALAAIATPIGTIAPLWIRGALAVALCVATFALMKPPRRRGASSGPGDKALGQVADPELGAGRPE